MGAELVRTRGTESGAALARRTSGGIQVGEGEERLKDSRVYATAS